MPYDPETGGWVPTDEQPNDPNAASPGLPTVGDDVTLLNIPSDETSKDVKDIYEGAGQGILDANKKAHEQEIGYRDPGSQIESADIAAKPGSSYLTPEQSVAGQLDKLLAEDSQYIQRARNQSAELSQSRGMLSSSMAAGAAQGAAIDRALPIAAQDADTQSKLALAQQQGDINQTQAQIEGFVSGSLQEQKYSLLDRSQALGKSFDAAIAGAEGEAAISMQELKSKWDFALQDSLKRLDYALKKDLDEGQYDKATEEAVRAQAVDLIENNQIAIENLLKDPDMLNLGADAMNASINNMINMATTSIQLAYDLAGLNIDGYVSDLLDTYESAVQFA